MESPVSMLETEREEELRLAAEAQATATALAEKQHKSETFKKYLKKVISFITIPLIAIALIVSIIWLVISLISAFTSTNQDQTDRPPDHNDSSTNTGDLASIEGYKCNNLDCAKVVDLDTSSILVRDQLTYYIYNRDIKSSARTTIREQSYQSITPFRWGEELFAVLNPSTGRSALYSITRNRQIGSFSYDSFFSDASAAEYANMQWIIGKYILAKQSSEIRLLAVFDGQEIVRASSKIFAYQPFFFGYESNHERRAYNDNGTRIISTTAGDYLAVIGDYLIHIRANSKTNMDIYDQNGDKLKPNDDFYKNLLQRLRDAKSTDYAITLATFQDVFTIAN